MHPRSAAERELLICLFFTKWSSKSIWFLLNHCCGSRVCGEGGCGQCQSWTGLFCFPFQNCINPITDITLGACTESRATLLLSDVEWLGLSLTATSIAFCPVLLKTWPQYKRDPPGVLLLCGK